MTDLVVARCVCLFFAAARATDWRPRTLCADPIQRPIRSQPITALADPGPVADPRPADRPRDAVPELLARLRRSLRGSVEADAGTRALYSSDASNYRVLPAAVVAPRDRDDLAEVVAQGRRGRRAAHDARRRDEHRRQRDRDRAWWWTSRGTSRASWRWTRRRGPRPCCRARSSTTSTGPPPPTGCASGPTRPRTAGARSAGCSATTPAGRARSGGGPRPRTRWGWRSSPRTGPRRRTGALGPALDARIAVGGRDARRHDPPGAAAVAPPGLRLRPGLAAPGARFGRRPGARRQRGDLRGGLRGHAPPRPAAGRCAACSSSPSPTTSPPQPPSRACCPSGRSPSRA